MRRTRLLWVVVAIVACSKPAPPTGGSGGSGSSGSGDLCSASALGLTGATAATPWKPPPGCTVKPARAPLLIADAAKYQAQLECSSTQQPPPGGLETAMLVATTRSFSPAQVGLHAFDDGTTITFVNIQRNNCPDDPRPMPGPDETFVFVVGAAGPREFAERSCSVPRSCP